MDELIAPGWPGIPGRWTSANKCGVGTALGGSAVWFTLSHGILNEIYAPRMDQAATRDLGLVVTAAGGFFSEEKRHADHETSCPVPGVPFYRLTNTCTYGRYRIEKEIITDPARPVVLQRIRFTPLRGSLEDYRLFTLLSPHLDNHGAGNTGRVAEYKGVPALFATRDGHALCLISSAGFRARSVGFVGVSDGWQDLRQHGELSWKYTLAEDGNVALTGELDAGDGELVLALGHGRTAEEAACQARASLAEGFEPLLGAYISEWERWQQGLWRAPDRPLFATSTMVVKTHQSKHIPGAILASLAVPWGFAKGDGDLGGYHLVWPRDMVEAAGGLLAAGAKSEAREALVYLETTQEADGHWPQNMWSDGRYYWHGVQMDETALPILLVDLARRSGALEDQDRSARRFWPMVRRAAAFLAQSGPVTQQDRWEEDGGYTPFTLAAEIAALLAAADLAELAGEPALAPYLRETADGWYDCIDRWLFVRGARLAREVGVDGYYMRITPADVEDGDEVVAIKNRQPGESAGRADAIISADALALVRFGLRAADDPRIRDTVRVIDALLRVELPAGPSWHRYNGDGYGEQEDGGPFDGTGIGRVWPLLTGERAHFALARGDRAEAERLLGTMERLAGDGGLLPEQSWDSPDIPERELYFGRPAGSAMPLVWAHAEYLKLARGLADGRVFDTPPQTVERYLKRGTRSTLVHWRFNHKIRELPPGRTLRVETLAPAVIHWSTDGWRTARDAPTRDSGLGVHLADLPTPALPAGSEILFTFYWPEGDRWEGADFSVKIP
ncbi:MAG TPA: glycoside hydrolase family 15 protein [Gemmatimonadales bacterium]|nr:glycoside hydrolase family 15 protein [Gemmatimonadales bacterium]